MENRLNEKIRLLLIITIFVLFIATTISSAAKEPQLDEDSMIVKEENNETFKKSTSSIPRLSRPALLPGFLLKIVNGDWDYWTNPPKMFAIPSLSDPMGFVGIGIKDPQRPLHIYHGWRDLLIIVESGDRGAHIQLQDDGGYSFISNRHGNFSISTGGTTEDNYTQDAVWVNKTGYVGIGTRNPTSKLHVIGKGTFTGGVDPPYISYSKESHESIRQYAEDVEEHEEVMQFWNGEAHRMEIYVISEDAFYTLTGELLVE